MKKTFAQLSRFGIVGVFSNVVGYLLYLALSGVGIEHKLAMTLVYTIGVTQGFILNKAWAFRYNTPGDSAFLRYCVSYVIGYFVNLAALYYFSDRLGWPHEKVQAAMVMVIAALLFAMQKFWVFRENRPV